MASASHLITLFFFLYCYPEALIKHIVCNDPSHVDPQYGRSEPCNVCMTPPESSIYIIRPPRADEFGSKLGHG